MLGRSTLWIPLLLAGAAAGCGKDEAAPAAGGGASSAQQPAPPPPDPAELERQRQKEQEAREARRAELQKKIQALKATVASAKSDVAEIEARHAEEIKSVEAVTQDLNKFRSRLRRLITDANTARSRYETIKKQFEEVQQFAESKVSGELRTLRQEFETVEERYYEIQSGWKRAMEDRQLGKVDDSPVKRELDALRVVKRQWFAATPKARSGAANSSEKQTINAEFRAWLAQEETRKAVVAKALTREEAPSGKTPDNYDFCELEFYLLLELTEDDLDRQNIAVEKKELGENEKKLRAVTVELETLRQKIATKESEGGPEFERYLDLKEQLKPAQEKAEMLGRMVSETRAVLEEARTTRDRHDQELAEARKPLEAAQQELKAAEAELRSM